MNLRPDQLAAQLERPLAPLWLLHGNEPLLVLEAADAIRAAARRQGYEERETLVVGHGFKWDALALAAGNLSLFGGAKLIDLRIPTGKPGRDGGDALQRYIAHLPSQTLTLVTLPEVDWATRKTAWFKALADAATTLELHAPERERLPEWVARRLSAQKQSAPPEALAFIADHVEGNLLAAHQEILKLGLLHGEGALTLEQVQDAVLDVA
ncbi:MAG TPA: DNA polymerase III subunit delta, partial [Thauera aminoaromatica]|nr:DNA polymerase III subunit delta [Thauera aminoaromatica]